MAVRCTRTYRSNRVYSEGEIIANPDQAGWVKRDAPGAWEDVVEAGETPPEPDEPDDPEEPDTADESDIPEVVTEGVVKPLKAAVKPVHRGPGRPKRAYK